MADDIIQESAHRAVTADGSTHLDAAVVWLTRTVERDYAQRSVFPLIRSDFADLEGANGTAYYLTQGYAEALLEDAQARVESTSKGLRNAYSAFVRGLKYALEQAQERSSTFEAEQPICTSETEMWEDWRGTKAQLQAMGIVCQGPWPGEPDAKRTRRGVDSRGYPTNIQRFSKIWCGLFEAHICLPWQEAKSSAAQESRDKVADRALLNLKHMPKSIDEFRRNVVGHARTIMSLWCDVKEQNSHGYTLSEEALPELHASFDAIAEAIMAAPVKFDAARHKQIAAGYQKEIAGADAGFQQKLSELFKPNAKILEGRPS